MAILVKDHKSWDKTSGDPVPSRPIVSGSTTINTHLSELLSEFIEPIALEAESAEIESSEEALHLIDSINTAHQIDEVNILKKLFPKHDYSIHDSDATDVTRQGGNQHGGQKK